MSDTLTVRDLHNRAMELSARADLARNEAQRLYEQAAAWERQALDRLRDVPNNEPTYSIIDTSHRSLTLLTEGKLEAAQALGAGVDLGRRTG